MKYTTSTGLHICICDICRAGDYDDRPMSQFATSPYLYTLQVPGYVTTYYHLCDVCMGPFGRYAA
jgi:hypothetical protein